jgi:hypothetical protein
MDKLFDLIDFLLLSMRYEDSFKNLRNHSSDILRMHMSVLKNAVFEILIAWNLRIALIMFLGQSLHNFSNLKCGILSNLVGKLFLLVFGDTQNIE